MHESLLIVSTNKVTLAKQAMLPFVPYVGQTFSIGFGADLASGVRDPVYARSVDWDLKCRRSNVFLAWENGFCLYEKNEEKFILEGWFPLSVTAAFHPTFDHLPPSERTFESDMFLVSVKRRFDSSFKKFAIRKNDLDFLMKMNQVMKNGSMAFDVNVDFAPPEAKIGS